MAKLTLKVTKVAYYKGALVYPNEIIRNYTGDVPSWATLAGGKEAPKDATINNKAGQVKQEAEQEAGQVEGEAEQEAGQVEGEKDEADKNNSDGDEKGGEAGEAIKADGETKEEKSEVELLEELEALLNEGIEKGIILEDADKKTIAEQVEEMKKLLGKE